MTAKVLRMPSLSALFNPEVDYPRDFSDERPGVLNQDTLPPSSVGANVKASVSSHTSQGVARASPPSLTVPNDTSSSPRLPIEELSPQATTIAKDEDDVDSLANQLDRTKIITAAPETARNVEVPKDYRLGMAFDIAKYYDLRADFRRLDKRKRDLGLLPRWTRRQKHGFRPEELIWYGAIDLKDCRDSDLANEIHPLLQRDLFDDTPDHVYDQLIPGLRLATFFLSHSSCMQFWVTLAKGDRRVDHEMSRRCGKTQHRISRNVPMTEDNVAEVVEYMRTMGDAKTIHYTFTPGLAFEGDAAFGTARTICDFQSEESETRPHSQLQSTNVRLHSDFYIIAKKLSTMVYPDPAQKLRFNFIFATLIVHELAHAIELSQWRNRAPSPYEPFLLHHNEAELGRMWESYMFGGQVAPINDRVDGIYGVATWNWPRSFGELDPERTVCHAVPMKYLEKIQQTETWERDYSLDDWRAFHIPRDGATSIYMNSVTTVSWSEEERVAKEALQERQLQDLEMPAMKKRETADGHAVAIKNAEVAEPEVGDPPAAAAEKGTTAQQVNRVKREPRSVLSRRERRAQRKTEQKKVLEKAAEPDSTEPVEAGVNAEDQTAKNAEAKEDKGSTEVQASLDEVTTAVSDTIVTLNTTKTSDDKGVRPDEKTTFEY